MAFSTFTDLRNRYPNATEQDWLNAMAFGEAGNQGEVGAALVADVARNRAANPQFQRQYGTDVIGQILGINGGRPEFDVWMPTVNGRPNQSRVNAIRYLDNLDRINLGDYSAFDPGYHQQLRDVQAGVAKTANEWQGISGGAQYYLNPAVATNSWAANTYPQGTFTFANHSFFGPGMQGMSPVLAGVSIDRTVQNNPVPPPGGDPEIHGTYDPYLSLFGSVPVGQGGTGLAPRFRGGATIGGQTPPSGGGSGNTYTLADLGFYENGNLIPDIQINDAFLQFAKGGGNTGTGLRYDPNTQTYVPTEGPDPSQPGAPRYKDNTIFKAPGGDDWSNTEEWYLRNFDPASAELKLGGEYYREIDPKGIGSFGGFDTSTGLLKEPGGGWADAKEMFLRNYDPDNTIFDLGGKYYREPGADGSMHWGTPTPKGGWASPEEKYLRNNDPGNAALELGGQYFREIEQGSRGAFGYDPSTGLIKEPAGGWADPAEQFLRNYDPGNAALQRGGRYFRDLPPPPSPTSGYDPTTGGVIGAQPAMPTPAPAPAPAPPASDLNGFTMPVPIPVPDVSVNPSAAASTIPGSPGYVAPDWNVPSFGSFLGGLPSTPLGSSGVSPDTIDPWFVNSPPGQVSGGMTVRPAAPGEFSDW